MNRKTKIIIITISIIVLAIVLLLVVGNSFGFFKYLKKGDIVNVITIKGIDVKILNNEDDALNLENAYPISDSEGMLSTPFEFTMTNNSSRALDYSIKVENDTEKQEACKLEDGTTCPVLSTDYIKYSYKKNDGTYSEPKILSSTNNVISSGSISTDEKITSSLILWIDSEAGNEIQNHYFFGKLIVTGEQQVSQVFKDLILANNPIISSAPTLTKTSQEANDESGLYKSTATNSGDPTYYFRGNVENNYVDFAGFTWRIVRINEDGTVRMILQNGINNNSIYAFSTSYSSNNDMYYSNSNIAKSTLEDWYNTNIIEKGYASNVSTGKYYCEQARGAYNDDYALNSGTNMIVYNNYIPDFTCLPNRNLNASIGLLTNDEAIHAGLYAYKSNEQNYLRNSNINWWLLSAAGFSESYSRIWYVTTVGGLNGGGTNGVISLRPVINLKADVWVTGNGTPSNPYKIDDTHKISVKETDILYIGTPVTATDGSKWHVLEESSSESKYVTLLSDYNLNSDGTYNTKCGRDINSEYYCSGIMFDSNNTNVYDEIDNSNIGYFMKNTYSPLITNTLPGTINVTLPTAEQIATADSQTFSQESNLYLTANTWLATTSYWTSTAKTPYVEYVWVVSGPDLHLGIADANTNAFFGARPVITTLKTNLIYN